MDCKSFKSMVPYFLLHLTSRVFETRRKRETLQYFEILFYSKKLANSSEYLHKEECQVDLNHLIDSQYKIKELTEKLRK